MASNLSAQLTHPIDIEVLVALVSAKGPVTAGYLCCEVGRSVEVRLSLVRLTDKGVVEKAGETYHCSDHEAALTWLRTYKRHLLPLGLRA